MAAGMVKHGKRHAACVLLLMALWYHPAFSRERNLPVIPYPAEVRMDGRGVYDMERSSWWIDPEADSLCVKAVERFFAGVAHDGPSRVRDREDASVLSWLIIIMLTCWSSWLVMWQSRRKRIPSMT